MTQPMPHSSARAQPFGSGHPESRLRSKSRGYAKAAHELRHELGRELPQEELKRLHRRDPVRHFAVVVRQLLLFVL